MERRKLYVNSEIDRHRQELKAKCYAKVASEKHQPYVSGYFGAIYSKKYYLRCTPLSSPKIDPKILQNLPWLYATLYIRI